MKFLNVCSNYFNAFQEISHFKENDIKTNALAILKILSYFSVVIPLGFAAAYGTASLYGRVCKIQNRDFDQSSEKSNEMAKETLNQNLEAETHNSPLNPKFTLNEEFFNTIIDQIPQEDIKVRIKNEVEKILQSSDFIKNPLKYLVSKMIDRGAERRGMDDEEYSRVVILALTYKGIPLFDRFVLTTDIQYLMHFAKDYFKDHENKDEIMRYFGRSYLCIERKDYNESLKNANGKIHLSQTFEDFVAFDEALRQVLTIFEQSEAGKPYTRPEL